MTRLLLLIFLSVGCLSTTSSPVPSFIFTDLDQAAVSIWLTSQQQNAAELPSYVTALTKTWQARRVDVVRHLDFYGDPIQLPKAVEHTIAEIIKAADKNNFTDLQHYSQRLLWDFSIIRAYHRHDFYPLDHFWPMYLTFLEIKSIIEDPMLELLEWQELECLFEELVCLVNTYEYVAEENLTRYAPNVDEDEHKQVIIQLYQCITDYKQALLSGYATALQWPCDQMGESMLTLLNCYSLRVGDIPMSN